MLLICVLMGCDTALTSMNEAYECADGETQRLEESCQDCSCQSGQWICDTGNCAGSDCTEGEHTMAEDGCNECICQDQQWYCTQNNCEAECTDGEETRSDCELCTCESGQWDCVNTCTTQTCIEDAVRYDVQTCQECVCTTGEWICTQQECSPSTSTCTEGEERPAGDGCNRCRCEDSVWLCTENNCRRGACEDGEVRQALDGCNECSCENGEWSCTTDGCAESACEEGQQKIAEDGCNLCVCTGEEWSCTMLSCVGEICEDGDVYTMNDGCSTCLCTENRWDCQDACLPHELECEPGDTFRNEEGIDCTCSPEGEAVCRCDDGQRPGPNCRCMRNGQWRCNEPPPESHCDQDDQCQVSDCIAALCIPNENGRCMRPASNMCFDDLIGTCGCFDSICQFEDEATAFACFE